MKSYKWLVGSILASAVGLFSILSWGSETMNWRVAQHEELLAVVAGFGGAVASIIAFLVERRKK